MDGNPTHASHVPIFSP